MPKFLASFPNLESINFDDNITEFCLVGRSNVGKSSLINALTNAKIARTSKTPGLTRMINLYDFEKYRLIDLPGYGYAKVSKDKKQDFDLMIGQILNFRKNIYGVIHVCDLEVITKQDLIYSSQIRKKFLNYFLVLNKADKVNKNYWQNNKQNILKQFNIDLNHVIVISALKKNNLNELKQKINNNL